MSCSSSSYTAHDASESGHTASLSRQPIQDSEEDPSEDEVNSIHSPTATPTLVPSLPTCQGDSYSGGIAESTLWTTLNTPIGPRLNTSRYLHMVTRVPIEGMESKLHISKCSDNSKVEYAVYLLQEYCPKSEVQKLESEFWNHAMVSSDIDKYTTRFHELAKLVPHMVTPEDKRIDRCIWGLAPELRGVVTLANPSTIQSAVVLANRLTNDAIRSGVWKKDNIRNKKREENQSRNQGGGNPNKRQRVARNYGMAAQGPN
ncbi:hypothetical protein Tco_0661315 [Tanacetum coccineum]